MLQTSLQPAAEPAVLRDMQVLQSILDPPANQLDGPALRSLSQLPAILPLMHPINPSSLAPAKLQDMQGLQSGLKSPTNQPETKQQGFSKGSAFKPFHSHDLPEVENGAPGRESDRGLKTALELPAPKATSSKCEQAVHLPGETLDLCHSHVQLQTA